MTTETIKRGPKPEHDFNSFAIGCEVVLDPLKQSSFKSKLSKFNKDFPKEQKHQYKYEQLKRNIVAIRIK